MYRTKSFLLALVKTNKRGSPHGAKVPPPDGRVIGRGELATVVVWAPLAGGKLQLTFALQGGGACDL